MCSDLHKQFSYIVAYELVRRAWWKVIFVAVRDLPYNRFFFFFSFILFVLFIRWHFRYGTWVWSTMQSFWQRVCLTGLAITLCTGEYI